MKYWFYIIIFFFIWSRLCVFTLIYAKFWSIPFCVFFQTSMKFIQVDLDLLNFKHLRFFYAKNIFHIYIFMQLALTKQTYIVSQKLQNEFANVWIWKKNFGTGPKIGLDDNVNGTILFSKWSKYIHHILVLHVLYIFIIKCQLKSSMKHDL
jgi:hypothetical protein